ncbi:hypothetical protein [Actinomarinicola tropica]|uniref:Uncharacterized protein n=1 Tax=Actinomarinicola tropica TaxID=2789776 RepID=A0A5Q2RMK4_9ACTN|nr:hypothetical protein [Actinomarinicola tropica]QGG95646.1 hypothetical protein GH723_11375 [Actinomarinicola tropica]
MAEHLPPRHDGGPGGQRRGAAAHPSEQSEQSTGVDADAPVDGWAAELRADAASQLRRREHWLRRQAADDATLAGVLVDHAEQGTTIAVTTLGGSRHVGRVSGASTEVVVLECERTRALVAIDAVATVQAVPGASGRQGDPIGHRAGRDHTTLADLLSHLVDGDVDVALGLRGGGTVAGRLVAVGQDLALVRPPDRGPLVYARLSSVADASFPASTSSG